MTVFLQEASCICFSIRSSFLRYHMFLNPSFSNAFSKWEKSNFSLLQSNCTKSTSWWRKSNYFEEIKAMVVRLSHTADKPLQSFFFTDANRLFLRTFPIFKRREKTKNLQVFQMFCLFIEMFFTKKFNKKVLQFFFCFVLLFRNQQKKLLNWGFLKSPQ